MVKNYIYNALFQILRIILPVITMPYVARVLSTDGVGAYSLSAAWANYFMIIGIIGVDSYGCREIAYVRDNNKEKQKIFWEINILKMLSVSVSIFIYSILVFGILHPENIILYYIQLINILSTFIDVSWYFSGMENFKSISIRNIIVKLICTVAIFVFVRDAEDVWIYTFILCFGQFAGQLVLWKEIVKELFPVILPSKIRLIYHFKRTILLWLPSLAASIYNYFDKIILGSFTSNHQVGIYDYSQNIVKIPATLIFAIATVTMPHAAADFSRGKDKIATKVFNKSMNIVTMLTLPMCFGFIAVSDNFVNWFLGDTYIEVASLLKISAWVILPISCSQIVGSQLLIAKGKEKFYSIAICCGAVVNLCLNAIVVKGFKAQGVLVASITAEIIVLIVMMLFSRKDYSLINVVRCFPKYIAMSIIMFLGIEWMPYYLKINGILLTIVQIVAGIFVYFMGLIFMRDSIVFEFLNKLMVRVKRKGKDKNEGSE